MQQFKHFINSEESWYKSQILLQNQFVKMSGNQPLDMWVVKLGNDITKQHKYIQEV